MLAAARYMAWVEATETALRALYSSPSLARWLHTDRYWQIRVISPETQRAEALIRGEIQDQQRSMTILREQLMHYQMLLASDGSERFLVCDTNVFVHGKPIHHLRWDEQFEEKRVCVLVPLIVIDELDSLKDRGNRNARGVLKDFDGFLEGNAALDRIELRQNVWLQIVDEPLGHDRLKSNDDEIVHQMTYFASLCEGPSLWLRKIGA